VIQKICIENGFYDRPFTNWLIKNIKPGWICVDIGSNIGYVTEVLSRLVGPEGKVIAFEPLEDLVNKYLEASKLNDYSDCSLIEMYPFGISNVEGTGQIEIFLDNIAKSSIIKDSRPFSGNKNNIIQEIKTKRLDSVYTGKVDFLKIDVEGHEPEVWDSLTENAKNCELILIELGQWHPLDFLKYIHEKYKMYSLDEKEIDIDTIMGLTEEDKNMDVVLRKR
jgi:FkbM family methyltransferase